MHPRHTDSDHAKCLCELSWVDGDVQTQCSVSVNCRNGDGLTPLLLVTRDVDLFDRLSDQLAYVYSPVNVASELLALAGSVCSLVFCRTQSYARAPPHVAVPYVCPSVTSQYHVKTMSYARKSIECCPWKGGEAVAHSFNCTPPRVCRYVLFSHLFFLSLYIVAYLSVRLQILGDSDTDRREILRDDTYRSRTKSLPFWGRYLKGSPNPKFLGQNFGHLTASRKRYVRA